jgi:hypothetical protein
VVSAQVTQIESIILALQDYSHVLGAITIVGWLLKTACNSVQLHVLDRDTNAVRKQLASRLPVLAILLLPEKLPVLPARRLKITWVRPVNLAKTAGR